MVVVIVVVVADVDVDGDVGDKINLSQQKYSHHIFARSSCVTSQCAGWIAFTPLIYCSCPLWSLLMGILVSKVTVLGFSESTIWQLKQLKRPLMKMNPGIMLGIFNNWMQERCFRMWSVLQVIAIHLKPLSCCLPEDNEHSHDWCWQQIT